MRPWSAAVVVGSLVVAWAVAPRDAGANPITLCVHKSSFQVRIIPPGESCRSTEQTFVVNTAGPTGATGPQGPSGPSGPQGPTGVVAPPEPRQPATLADGWINYEAKTIFVLPAGYRPSFRLIPAAEGNCQVRGDAGGICRIDVLPDGTVQLNDLLPSIVSLTGITFRVE
jgi:hypothetical protein